MTGLEIAALMAIIGGAGAQYKAQTDAAKRSTRAVQESLARQAEFQRQAEGRAMDEAMNFNTDDRAQAQQQIEQQLTQDFLAPVESAQQINAAATTTQGDVSGDYQAAKSRSDANTQAAAQSLAKLMGKVTSAGRMRGNEAIRFSDAAMDIDRIGSFARGRAGADELAIRHAGTPDAGMMAAGQILQGLGTAGLTMDGGSAAKGAAPGELGSGMYQTPVPTGVGTGTKGLGTGFWGLNSNTAAGLPIRY